MATGIHLEFRAADDGTLLRQCFCPIHDGIFIPITEIGQDKDISTGLSNYCREYTRNKKRESYVPKQQRSSVPEDFIDYEPIPQFEPEVVRTADLAPVVSDWMERHNLKFKDNDVNGYYDGQNGFTAFQYIEHHAGLHSRQVFALLNQTYNFMALSNADKLLTAIELSYLLGNVVPVIPNPRWSQERWFNYMVGKGCDPEELEGV